MNTLHASFFRHVKVAAPRRGTGRAGSIARDILGLAVLIALLAAGIALRACFLVPLS